MGSERTKQLEAAGIVWSYHDQGWEVGYKHFLEIVPNEIGERKVSRYHVTADGAPKFKPNSTVAATLKMLFLELVGAAARCRLMHTSWGLSSPRFCAHVV